MLFFRRPRSAHSRHATSLHKARLRVEQLEMRCVPAMTLPHNEFLVNSNTSYTDQTSSSGAHGVAVDSAGDSVITWGRSNGDGSGSGVSARRFTTTS